MSSSGSRPKKRKKYPPPWRKPEDVELSEEIRDLQRDIATHSTSTASVAPLAEDKQPRSQEHSESERDHPTASRTRRRRSTSTNKRAPRRKLEVPDLTFSPTRFETKRNEAYEGEGEINGGRFGGMICKRGNEVSPARLIAELRMASVAIPATSHEQPSTHCPVDSVGIRLLLLFNSAFVIWPLLNTFGSLLSRLANGSLYPLPLTSNRRLTVWLTFDAAPDGQPGNVESSSEGRRLWSDAPYLPLRRRPLMTIGHPSNCGGVSCAWMPLAPARALLGRSSVWLDLLPIGATVGTRRFYEAVNPNFDSVELGKRKTGQGGSAIPMQYPTREAMLLHLYFSLPSFSFSRRRRPDPQPGNVEAIIPVKLLSEGWRLWIDALPGRGDVEQPEGGLNILCEEFELCEGGSIPLGRRMARRRAWGTSAQDEHP
ncbi:hypothetical protein EDB86DRAFT_2833163 [Lactarius hatsudake]|nr:hypothetical protein EDB86DRAFT_2833163 [Lactarius hatsudake]